ncbi:MAG: hypothetical protein K8T25_10560 [Planctomycetia bacterium]|nr:hypothetical protein [Planctomycetia bacterium]
MRRLPLLACPVDMEGGQGKPDQMSSLSNNEVLRIFEVLQGHHGCPESVLNDAEQLVSGRLPPTYRRLMLLDADRLLATGVFLPPDKLSDHKQEAQELLLEDNYSFRLERTHVVFAWLDIYAFYFFDAIGSDDVPVFEFNYYSSDNDRLPRECSRTVPEFFAKIIRDYLKL